MNATQLLALFAALSIVVAGVTFWMERRRLWRRAEARMSAFAFLLRRQLESWLADHDWPKGAAADEKRLHVGLAVTRHFDPAEKRATTLLEESGDARLKKARQAKHAAALFFEATSRINVFCFTAQKPESRKDITGTVLDDLVVLGTRADVGATMRREFDEVPKLLRWCNNTLGMLIDKDLDLDAALAKARKAEQGGEATEQQ